MRLLETILSSKRAEITAMRLSAPITTSFEPEGLVYQTLRRDPGQPLRIIAEIKPRSPSAGQLSNALSIEQRAQVYAEAGAMMISVLVDGPFFGGSYENLIVCRKSLAARYGTSRPRLLCKEFVLEPGQIEWAARAGADSILLIAKIVPADELRQLIAYARHWGLEPVVEVTTLDELRLAEDLGARVIGVNARNLDTLEMDQARAAEVLAYIAETNVRVSLSGLVLPDDVARIAQGKADAALIGEALMRQDDPGELLSEMVRRARIDGS
jgi:indole-3-glycerol phosphate synthase